MKPASILVCIVLLFSVASVSAQAPEAPKPAPELDRLNYFAGTWNTEVDMKASPFGPAGTYTGKDHTEWMNGKFFLVTHSNTDGPMGPGTEVAVMGYKADDKVYTYDAYSSMGEADHATGTVAGDTWTWTSSEKMGGKSFNGRFTVKELSPASYSFMFEMQPEGGSWSTLMEGKATKAGGEQAAAGKAKKEGKKEGKADKN
jgi:hypothetical protein